MIGRTEGTAMLARSLGLALALAPALAADETTNLTGSWTLNPARSDDATAKIEEAAGPAQVKGGGGGRILPPTGTKSEVDRVRLRQWMLDRAREFEDVSIEQSPTEVKIRDREGIAIFYFGREHVRELEEGAKVHCRTYSKGPQLVIEQAGDKLKAIQVLTLMPGGQQLIQALRFESGLLKQPLEVRRIYDRSAGSW